MASDLFGQIFFIRIDLATNKLLNPVYCRKSLDPFYTVTWRGGGVGGCAAIGSGGQCPSLFP